MKKGKRAANTPSRREGEPPLLKKKGNEGKYPVSPGGRATPFTKRGMGKGIILSQFCRKKVATLFYTFSEGGKKMSEKQEKKNVFVDGEMAARGVAGALLCAQNEK